MSSQTCLETADDKMGGSVEIKSGSGGAAGRGLARYFDPGPLKMLSPYVISGIEKLNDLAGFWVGCRLFCSLPQGTMDAGKSQVLQHRRPIGDFLDDVIDVKRCRLPVRSKPTILTAVLGALGHTSPQF